MSAESHKKYEDLPAGVYTTAIMFGRPYVYKLALRILRGCWRELWYIWRSFGWRSAWSFIFTKLFVPVGEGSGSGIYFFLGPFLRRHPSLAPRPRYVEIENTTICNKQCIMCEHTFWTDQVEHHTEFADFKFMLDQFRGLRWLHTTGEGSSFLNPDFPKIMEYARREKHAALYIVDHLADVGEAELRHLVEIGLFGLYVSVDAATRETYEKIRKGCNWDSLQDNLRQIIAIKKEKHSPLPEICFRYIILKENAHEMPAFLDLIAQLATPENRPWIGAGGVRIELVGNLEFTDIKDQSVSTVARECIDAVIAKTRQYNFNTFFFHTESNKLPSIRQCYAWLEPYIMDGGYVLPCCNVLMSNRRTDLRKYAFGNLHDRTFDAIWNSERYRRFRCYVNDMSKPVPAFCAICRAFRNKERIAQHGVDLNT